MKSDQAIPIKDCGEALVAIPQNMFALETPHPYQKLGAPYGKVSPFQLRESVLRGLQQAQTELQKHQAGWKIKIFDAYRPIAVQQFMVDYTFERLRQQYPEHSESAIDPKGHRIEDSIAQQVSQFWAQPSDDLNTPPPHSTGAAIDITLVNEIGETLDLGGEIDEISPRSYPDFYQKATGKSEKIYHQRRELLRGIMLSADFRQHPQEWWHFSLGDQMWAWLKSQERPHFDL
ncbi:MAG: M15 family metallopeptidase [Chroococcales cyanobacterium]